ncbi:DUF6415 family natural product biosynthesis protein [Streptomyces sp. bgisy031]|uniref:DUF6415 family natural product biosynthesis protein n=1 Tax=Streptomyces sp. bgisy031 TaxID=3413772 RepID=UPI003D750BE8
MTVLKGTALPAPTADEVIRAALSAPSDYPGPDRLRYLYAAARQMILVRLPVVAAQVEGAPGGPERASRERAVDEAEAILREGLSPSCLAASLTVSALGRALLGLERVAGGER